MPGLGDTLQGRAGPLPTWAWVGLGTTGIAGYLIYRKKKALAAQAADTSGGSSNLGSVPISNLVVGAEPMPIQMGDTFVNIPPDSDQGPQPVNPGMKPQPVTRPLIPVAQKPPPSQIPAHPVPPKPNPTPAPKQQTYTVKSGDTLSGIAQRFYDNGNLWQLIYAANKALIGANPNLIHPGQVLVIPAKS